MRVERCNGLLVVIVAVEVGRCCTWKGHDYLGDDR